MFSFSQGRPVCASRGGVRTPFRVDVANRRQHDKAAFWRLFVTTANLTIFRRFVFRHANAHSYAESLSIIYDRDSSTCMHNSTLNKSTLQYCNLHVTSTSMWNEYYPADCTILIWTLLFLPCTIRIFGICVTFVWMHTGKRKIDRLT